MNGAPLDTVPVPSSQRPVGFSSLVRDFSLPRLSGHERAILHFDAVNYYSEISLNGTRLGNMGPYLPSEYEFTAQAKEGSNRLTVEIADLTPGPDGKGKAELQLGVNPGWEAYGGIIRDVHVELRPAAFIENVQFGYRLNPGYTKAECTARIFISSAITANGRVEVVLEQGDTEAGRGEQAVQLGENHGEVVVPFSVEAPVLWAPESPNLYQLKVTLTSDEGTDTWQTQTGFREIKIAGNQFVLNGKPLVLGGVCRHDMWKGQGFTLTSAQIEQDMRMIKELGANFVRLVHYPHDRRVIEHADKVGLLVSEEPGYWGMDFTTLPPETIELGHKIMEGVIRRDWNSPSVFAWLLGNECTLTVEYLSEGKERCRRLDPLNRFVSFANNMPMEKAKPIFEQAGLDFFDEHVYTYDLDDFARTANFYGDSRPVTFTEWGGKAIGQSQTVMGSTVNHLLDLIEAKAIAGHSFWSWQDMRQYSRIDDEMRDAILESGVVTEDREPRPVPYMQLSRLFAGRRSEADSGDKRPVICPLKRTPWNANSKFLPIDLQPLVDGPEGKKSWTSLESLMADFWKNAPMAADQWKRSGERFLLWQGSEINISGVPFQIPEIDGYIRPAILTSDRPEFVVPLAHEGIRLHILGHVTLPEGFPAEARDGEIAATYTIRYESGKSEEVPLRHGREIVRANTIYVATRIDPEATNAQRALLFTKDVVREQYQVLLFSHDLHRGRAQNLTCRLEGKIPLAVFAITLEAAG